MNTHRLPALIGSNPLGALAAFGLLRLLSEDDPNARLSFVEADDWLACIHTERHPQLDDLLAWLHQQQGGALPWLELWPGDDLRIQAQTFREWQSEHLNDAALQPWLSALAADGAVDRQKGLIKPSAFYMVSGQMNFIAGLKDIRTALQSASDDRHWREALLGPWSYRTQAHSLGWDPAGERLHALRHRAPTAEKATCIPGAIWLAAQALPWFPCLSEEGRECTLGYTRDRRQRSLHWPVFTDALDADTLRLLISSGQWTQGRSRGLAARYASERFEFGQGYAVFRPARPV